MNVLAVVAHPDDVELFCGGTFRKYYELTHNISIIITTNGRTGTFVKVDDSVLIETRKKEQLEAAKLYEADVQFIMEDDGEIFDCAETRRKVINAIRKVRPDIIFTHNLEDQNIDHKTTAEIVAGSLIYLPLENVRVEEAPLRKQPTLFLFDTYIGVGSLPVAFVDITEQMESKRIGMAMHKSQDAKGMYWKEMVEIQSKLRGMQAGYQYAEGFSGYQTFGSMPDYKLLP